MSPLRVALLVPVLCLSSSCGDDPVDDHGVVKVQIARSSQSEDTFAGTVRVDLRLNYLVCLQEFYTSAHTELAQSGIEGGPVFEEWAARLCDPDDAGNIDIPNCTVDNIQQNLGGSGSQESLRVSYTMHDENLDLKVFRFGPLPTEKTADGCVPMVQLDQGSIQGFNADNEVIWGVESFTPFNEAVTDQSGELTAKVAIN